MSEPVTSVEPTVEDEYARLVKEHNLELLPNGKYHVSFSEMRDWQDCSYRHKLKHIDKVGEDPPGVHLDFGTSVHSACEAYLKTGTMDRRVFLTSLKELWDLHAAKRPGDFTVKAFKEFAKQGLSILLDIPKWFDEQFPGWTLLDAEHALYEQIDGTKHAFKGFIDVVIKVPGPNGKDIIWLLDWKTCSWGWAAEKKGNPQVKSQLVLYKNFWAEKTGTDPKAVKCGFILLKRTGKPGAHCELVPTSVGDVVTERSLKVIHSMVGSMKRGFFIKNRESCRFCQYYGTPHCT